MNNEIDGQIAYMRAYTSSFWDKHQRAVAREEYNLYRNYVLALSHFSTTREVALEYGYDADTFAYSFLTVIDNKSLNEIVNEKLEKSLEVKKFQRGETDRAFKIQQLRARINKNNQKSR